MATEILPVLTSPARAPGLLVHPLQSFSLALAAWKARRRRSADARLLMRLEPYMLRDIGVLIAEPRGASAMLRWHPALLATSMQSDAAGEAEEI